VVESQLEVTDRLDEARDAATPSGAEVRRP